ncbi:SPOR domain-containing protein [Vibrio mexicanus]|uniref:SPOR domain-containing protein n=1 Tax=Vibrio mexicanus TaxID=1004326 RepID=UPI00063C105E|nr:SPOR domain-containing protein [Vibrio mexicanus]
MKKITIISFSVLLGACASGEYVTDVSSESYREDYKTEQVEQPVMTEQGVAEGISEENVAMKEIKTTAKSEPMKKEAAVAIIPPTKKQVAMNPRYGFTIQVVAVGSQAKVDSFAKKLPVDEQPIWENYKVVNGTKWYTVLYGDYATRTDALKAIQALPSDLKSLKPFVKSIDSIKNSEYPTLNKLN